MCYNKRMKENQVSEKAYAKLNISLDVSKPRADGFHDMVMVMQTVSLCDDITIEFNDSGSVLAKSNLQYIPSDNRNLAVRAAKVFLDTIGQKKTGANISMVKRVPVGAGMGGGSSDAAAVFRALNRYYENTLTDQELLQLSEQVGSDVPFCVLGGTALAKGRGEVLTPLEDIPECTFVICKPEFSISTPELFRALDRIKLRTHPDTNGILKALKESNVREICRRMYNVFENVPDRRLNVVPIIKRELIDGGAEGAVMTGTGSAVFGIFTDETRAEATREKLKKEYGFCVTAKPVPSLL